MIDFIILFSTCVPVRGYNTSIIYDIQRPKNSNKIPNSLYDIISMFRKKSISKIKKVFNNKYDAIINEYIDFLIEKEFVLKCEKAELNCFPYLNLSWNTPSIITNTIIEISIINNELLSNIISQFSILKCNAVQLHIQNYVDFLEIENIISMFEFKRILSIEILLYYNVTYSRSVFEQLINKYPRITNIFIFNAPKSDTNKSHKIHYFKENIKYKNECGTIKASNFALNTDCFTESQHYNTCLNRKVCIDAEGNIKNCPAMERSFGNIKDTTIEEAINKPGFKDLWGIRKDDIDVCKDCEFRYMCTDCRAFIKDPNNIYSQPAKCPYNPYIAKWAWDEGYITVEQWRTENPDWEKDVVRKPLVEVPQEVECDNLLKC